MSADTASAGDDDLFEVDGLDVPAGVEAAVVGPARQGDEHRPRQPALAAGLTLGVAPNARPAPEPAPEGCPVAVGDRVRVTLHRGGGYGDEPNTAIHRGGGPVTKLGWVRRVRFSETEPGLSSMMVTFDDGDLQTVPIFAEGWPVYRWEKIPIEEADEQG